ncbi:hypothetical protein CYY_003071 [Polysphondylium violaceum]|uniref:Ras guanine nucleotide exchange factor n=1 Tax=Polysphondylium violaceum TaxID=133409 RepID=A0A8J4PVD1_9MYCE|nr:hypothetical protein CYY_003071 [Polysphondylium violaceum]
MTTTSKSIALIQSLTCSICNNLYKDPNTLVPCGHSFCFECISKDQASRNIKNCFQCKQEYQSHIVNHGLKQMIDALEQRGSFSMSSSIGGGHSDISSSASSLGGGGSSNSLLNIIEGLGEHRYSTSDLRSSTGDLANIKYCTEHFEEYYSFCEPCQCPICPRCLLTSHNRHGTVVLTKEYLVTKMNEYKSIVEGFKKKISLYQDNIVLYQKEVSLLDGSYNQCKMAIQMMVANLHKALKYRETYLLKEIGTIHYTSHFDLTDRAKTLEGEIEEMEKLISQTEKFRDADINSHHLKFEFLEQFYISRLQSKKNVTTDLKPLYKTDLLFYKANNERITEIINNTLGNISLLTYPLDDMDNVNIWDEPKQNIYIEFVRIGNEDVEIVKYGSLNKLIERLTLVDDQNYSNVFLLTYHSFCTSKKLLKKLIERYTPPDSLEAYNVTTSQITEIQSRVRAILVKWITEYPQEYDQDTINLFQNFNNRMQSEYNSIVEIENLQSTLEEQFAQQNQLVQQQAQQQALNQSSPTSQSPTLTSFNCKLSTSPLNLNSLSLINEYSPPPSPRHSTSSSSSSSSPRLSALKPLNLSGFNNNNNISLTSSNSNNSISQSNNNSFNLGSSGQSYFSPPQSPTSLTLIPSKISNIKNLEFSNIDELELAKQLTLMEFEYYCKIKPVDLLTGVDLKHKSPTITNMLERFNNISTWVSTTIVHAQHLKGRVKIMNKFIKVAEHLKNMNNFNSLTAIILALQRSTVTRKELTKQSAKAFTDLEKLVSSDDGYKQYRTKLAQLSPPCIPYISVNLTDIMDLERKNPPNVSVKVSQFKSCEFINFTRRQLISRAILDLMKYQKFSFNYMFNSIIQEYLNLHIDSDSSNN